METTTLAGSLNEMTMRWNIEKRHKIEYAGIPNDEQVGFYMVL